MVTIQQYCVEVQKQVVYFVQRFVVERRVFTVLQTGAVAPIIEPTERPGARTRHGGENLKFPEEGRNGAKTRSGDFGEILISDFIEYNLNFWVPRTRFSDRANRNNPTQGVDVIGFKSDDYSQNLINDELIIFEVKCKLTGNQAFLTKTRMETAIFDSAKDFNVRKAESLNGLKQIYLKERNTENANKIKRFQNPTDRPYIELSGASSLILDGAYDETKISEIDASNHPNLRNLKLILIKGENLMRLVHTLYERAANEAEQF